jgi:hypothetical protein
MFRYSEEQGDRDKLIYLPHHTRNKVCCRPEAVLAHTREDRRHPVKRSHLMLSLILFRPQPIILRLDNRGVERAQGRVPIRHAEAGSVL